MPSIDQAKILILSTDGFEQSELMKPLEDLRAKGATVHVVTPEGDDIRGWKDGDWGETATADHALTDVSADDYDAIVLPGGQINPDVLRVNEDAVALIKAFGSAGKPVAAVCHAPWLLIESGLASGRRLTGYPSIRTDLKNAGADVVDETVVEDRGVITSRNPDDLDAFVAKIVECVERDQSRAAA